MKLFFEILCASVICIGGYLVNYIGVFYRCLSDDVDLLYGKKRMRNRRKKEKGFWRKFLFLDIRKEVITWHYAMFWINLVSCIIMLIVVYVSIVCGNEGIVGIIGAISSVTFMSSCLITGFSCGPSYARNNWNRKEYRRKYRKEHPRRKEHRNK